MGKRNNKIHIDLETSGLLDGGLSKSQLAIFTGSTGKSNLTLTFLESAKKAGLNTFIYNAETASDVKKQGKCIIYDTIEMLKRHGFNAEDYGIHTHEKIGETIFPVTHHKNGMVTIDYPQNPIKQ